MANSKYSFLKNNVPMKECMIFWFFYKKIFRGYLSFGDVKSRWSGSLSSTWTLNFSTQLLVLLAPMRYPGLKIRPTHFTVTLHETNLFLCWNSSVVIGNWILLFSIESITFEFEREMKQFVTNPKIWPRRGQCVSI
jgi:hypothetical protein